MSRVTTYPKGWFCVAFSHEIGPCGVLPLKYFGKDLVAFRGEDGAVRILDAHCPHLGAHFGYGGKVCENSIQCPFHAWRFSGDDGKCVAVPYAKRVPPGAKVSAWTVKEINGFVMMWHDEAGSTPTFDVPLIAEYGSPAWMPWSCHTYEIKTQPREVVENLADKAHFPSVHRTEIDEFSFEVDGVSATQRVKGRALLEGGGVDPFSSSTTYHGPGYLLMRMDGQLSNRMLFAHTPIDEHRLALRMAVMLKIVGNREKTELYTGSYMTNLKKGFEDDIAIWEHKVFRERPTLCDGDGPIGKLRTWYRQFYEAPPADPSREAAAE